jgi:hypothetical protein
MNLLLGEIAELHLRATGQDIISVAFLTIIAELLILKQGRPNQGKV